MISSIALGVSVLLLGAAPVPTESRLGPLFSTLDRLDATPIQLSASMGMLLDGRRDGVPLRLALSLSASKDDLGLYTTLGLTKLTGAATSASALSNLDLGAFHARRLADVGWLVLRGGALLPIGDADEVGAPLNGGVAAQRLADAVLYQPAALGARTSASLILLAPRGVHGPRHGCCSVRLDAGLDGYAPYGNGWQLSPRWGAGMGYRHALFVATLEYAGARYPATVGAPGTLHHTLGASLRSTAQPEGGLQPALSVSVPVGAWDGRWFLGLEMTIRQAPEPDR